MVGDTSPATVHADMHDRTPAEGLFSAGVLIWIRNPIPKGWFS
jgi:hypothetical protein